MTPWPTNSESRATTLILQLFLLSDTPTVINSQQLSRFTFSKMQIECQLKFIFYFIFFMNAHSFPLLGSRRLSPLTEATSSCVFIASTAQLCRLYKVFNLYGNLFWRILDVHWHNMDLLQNDSLHLLMSYFSLHCWSKNMKESYCTLGKESKTQDLLIRILTVCDPH